VRSSPRRTCGTSRRPAIGCATNAASGPPGPPPQPAAHIQLRETIEERLPTLRLIGAGPPATAFAGQLTQVAV
jgi:hypothetical protein